MKPFIIASSEERVLTTLKMYSAIYILSGITITFISLRFSTVVRLLKALY
jgi:hypothetical protein